MREECTVVSTTASRLVTDGRRMRRSFAVQTAVFRIEIERLILYGRERPFGFTAHRHLVAGLPHFEADARRSLPAVVVTLQEMCEKTLLDIPRLAAVERLPFAAPVREEPFVARADALESFERSARVQSVVRPARAHER